MDTEFDNEYTRLFDIILNEYDIKNKDRLKSCIVNVLSNRGENRYLSQLEYDYEQALRYAEETGPSECYEVWDAEYNNDVDCYRDLFAYRESYIQEVENEFNSQKSSIMELYRSAWELNPDRGIQSPE